MDSVWIQILIIVVDSDAPYFAQGVTIELTMTYLDHLSIFRLKTLTFIRSNIIALFMSAQGWTDCVLKITSLLFFNLFLKNSLLKAVNYQIYAIRFTHVNGWFFPRCRVSDMIRCQYSF
jgi:hypothetical protein